MAHPVPSLESPLAASKRSLQKNERKGLKSMTISILFLCELVIVTQNAWNKRLNPFFR